MTGAVVLAVLGAFAPRIERVMDSASASVPQIEGRVTHVRDGDTIEVGAVAIRFRELDCTERGTKAGDAATLRMKRLAEGAQVTCDLAGRQSYDREIGSCRLSDGRDLGRMMIESGTCQRYR
ncbi:MAG: thermonuclease family protein [Pseudomonadota bacterium]